MNIVICAIAKNENAYLYEWAEYHLALGFSHIYLYDNNDLDGEKISDVFIDTDIKDKITIINVRGEKCLQKKVYQECYDTFDFDWCAFIDIDEYITLKEHNSISDFLLSISDFEAVHLNWMCFGDSNELLFRDQSIIERFNKPWKKDVFYAYTNIKENSHIKSIIRKGLHLNWEYDGEEWSSNPHTPYGLKKLCNAASKQILNSPFSSISYEVAYIRHYTTKTIEEYAIKVSRQCADCTAIFYSFPKFFRVNSLSIAKILWLKKNFPDVKIWDCIKENIRFNIVNRNLPLRFLFRSLRNA